MLRLLCYPDLLVVFLSDICYGVVCENGGHCVETELSYTCTCPLGFIGMYVDFIYCRALPHEEIALFDFK